MGKLFFLSTFASDLSRQSMDNEHIDRPYRLGVALSGGGARGFAHAGALMAIEEAGLRPDAIAGVSAGSVVAVLYAGGVEPLKMADMFARTGFRDFAELNFARAEYSVSTDLPILCSRRLAARHVWRI